MNTWPSRSSILVSEIMDLYKVGIETPTSGDKLPARQMRELLKERS